MVRHKKPTAYNKCIGQKLRGKHYKGKTARNAAFRKAARVCKGKGHRKGRKR